ncbi:MAG TPA: EpsI family protein [Burkholderiales bacterium]|jgi:EpsI family protein|nr:EpsI family protein [Burkholderiales bacterium]
MIARRRAYLILAAMLAASVAAVLAKPRTLVSTERKPVSLESMVPRSFGDWTEANAGRAQVVNPQTQELLDRLYSEVLTRVYVHTSGYRIMLSIAYGSDQRGGLQAHKPEVCYPAQGFAVHRNEVGRIATAHGDIPVRRLSTTLGARHEPLTYWFTVGDRVVQGKTQKRIVDLAFGLTGRVPDGLLFRVSSVDTEQALAFRMQEQFVGQLLASASPLAVKRLTGLGNL